MLSLPVNKKQNFSNTTSFQTYTYKAVHSKQNSKVVSA